MREIDYSFKLFYSNLKFLRGKMSQNKLAEELGISPTTLSQYINQKRIPNIDFLMKICSYFNISADTFLGRDLQVHDAKLKFVDKVLQGNRTLSDPNVLKKFENIDLYCYYYSGSRVDVIREGMLKLSSQYGEREFVVGEFRSYSQSYFCKLVVEGTDHYYIYGTNMDYPNRMMMAFLDHQFLCNADKLNSAIGLVQSTSSRGRIMTQIAVLSSIKLIDNPNIPDGLKTLKRYLDMSNTTNTGFILSNDINADFSKWLLQYMPPNLQ